MRKRPEALVIGVPAGEAARWSQACANLPGSSALFFGVEVHKSRGTFRMNQTQQCVWSLNLLNSVEISILCQGVSKTAQMIAPCDWD